MTSRTDQLTKGLISLAVLLMLAAALIADQARANLPAADAATADMTAGTRGGILLDADTLRKIDSLPYTLGRMLPLPIATDLCIDILLPESRGDNSANSPVR